MSPLLFSVLAQLCPVRSLNLFLLSSASHTLWDSLFSQTPVGFLLKDLCLMILTSSARAGLIRGRFALNTRECRARQAYLCIAIPSVDTLCLCSLINLAVTEKSAVIHSEQRAPSSLLICSLVVGMRNYSNTFLFTLTGSCVPEEGPTRAMRPHESQRSYCCGRWTDEASGMNAQGRGSWGTSEQQWLAIEKTCNIHLFRSWASFLLH